MMTPRPRGGGVGYYFHHYHHSSVCPPTLHVHTDMRFVKKITQPDFEAKNSTPLISPNFISFGDRNTKN